MIDIPGWLSAVAATVALGFAYFSSKSAASSSAAAALSAATTKDSYRIQYEEFQYQNRAIFRVVEHALSFGTLESPAGSVEFRVEMRNEGGKTAYDPVMSMFFHQTKHHTYGGSPRSRYDELNRGAREQTRTWLIEPGAVAEFRRVVSRENVGLESPRRVSLIFGWRDISGTHTMRYEYAWWNDIPNDFKDGSGARSLLRVVYDKTVVFDGLKSFPNMALEFDIPAGHDYPDSSPKDSFGVTDMFRHD